LRERTRKKPPGEGRCWCKTPTGALGRKHVWEFKGVKNTGNEDRKPSWRRQTEGKSERVNTRRAQHQRESIGFWGLGEEARNGRGTDKWKGKKQRSGNREDTKTKTKAPGAMPEILIGHDQNGSLSNGKKSGLSGRKNFFTWPGTLPRGSRPIKRQGGPWKKSKTKFFKTCWGRRGWVCRLRVLTHGGGGKGVRLPRDPAQEKNWA